MGQDTLSSIPSGPVPSFQVEAQTHLTWDKTLERAATQQRDPSRPDQAILTLLRANHHLSHVANLDELLHLILNDAIAALEAQRGAILLADDKAPQLVLKAHSVPATSKKQPKFSRTYTAQCYKTGESLLCHDVSGESVRSGDMSSIVCALLRTPRKRIGVLHLDRGPKQPRFTKTDLELADAVAASVAVGIECAQLVELQRDQFVQTMMTLARTVEMRDQYTGDHTRRVTDYSLLLADELKLDAVEKYHLQIGAPLHDIGKIGIEDAILRKPGRLDPGELETMKTHAARGAEILGGITSLAPMIPIVRHHHEKWDGSGYPDGLKENQIERIARIVAVADAFDAMTTNRPYRCALSTDIAFAELTTHAGTHFDPTCAQAFLRRRDDIERRMKQG